MNCNGKRIYANKGKGKPDQDPQWYLSKSDAAKEAAQLGFTNATGDTISYAGSEVPSIPGIMALQYAPMIGHWINVASDIRWAQNPYNMTFRRVYAQMRRKNTASPVYTANDLGVYMWCVASLYNYHAHIARAIKIVKKFKNRNKYYAKALVAAMGIDYDDLVKNQADLRIWLNTYAKRVNNVLSVPKLPLYERQYWLNSHMWKDGNTDKSQVYIPTIIQYHKYNATKTSDGGGTDVVQIFSPLANVNVANIMLYGEQLLEPLITDDDILLISADVDKWYGGNQFTLPDVTENDEYEPEFSLEVLTQIQNTNIITMDSNNGLTQNATNNYLNNILVLTGFDFKLLNEYQDHAFITMPNDRPSPEEIVVATRTLSGVVSHSTNTITELSCGSEICVGMDILYYNTTGVLQSLVQDDGSTILQGAIDNGVLSADTEAKELGLVHMFDMMPKLYLIEDAAAGNYAYTVLTEVENSTPVAISRLDQIHYMALLNEFGFYDETKSGSTF